MKKIFIIFIFVFVYTFALEKSLNYEEHIYKEAYQFLKECKGKDLSFCLKEKILKYIDTIPNNFNIMEGIKLKQININLKQQTINQNPINLPNEIISRESTIDNLILEKITTYLKTHTIEFSVTPKALTFFKDNAVEEARKKKKKGNMGLIYLFCMKAAALAALTLKGLGLVAFKALVISKVALTIAGIIALKKLVEPKHHSQTYEIVAHPHEDGYDRYDYNRQ